MQKEKKFNTDFSIRGWAVLYFVAVGLNWALNIASNSLLKMAGHNYIMTVVTVYLLSIVQVFLVWILYILAYGKALLFFINTLSLGENKFAIKIGENSFLKFMLANMVISIVTLGIYFPWACKMIADKLTANTEYTGGGHFDFRSKASKLFVFNFVCVAIALLIIGILIAVITVVLMPIIGHGRGDATASFLLLLKHIGTIFVVAVGGFLVIFFVVATFAVIMQVFMVKWLCNVGYTSQAKNRVYILDINMKDATLFTLGQTLLLCITIGFYSGVYLLNIYTYFSVCIIEKDGDKKTGRLVFKKPDDKGAGYLFLQVLLSVITLGFYVPFAQVAYAKFFINNTYLNTEEGEEEDGKIISTGDEAGDSTKTNITLIGENVDSAKENAGNLESLPLSTSANT